jgi:hypothetical protein
MPMKPTQQELTNWAITQIQEKYPEDVALLIAISGHALENDCHGACFDYFIPANERGNQLARTFILDGVGHDLYPRSWQRIENMANLDDDFTNGLGDAQVLYYRSEEDLSRFRAFQAKLRANLRDREFTLRKALQKLDAAMDIYRTMIFDDRLYQARMAAGFIARFLAQAVAYVNETYFRQRLELETLELAQMKDIPENFITCFEAIVQARTITELRQFSYEMICAARAFFTAKSLPGGKQNRNLNFADLAGWYEEGSLTWRRIYAHCDTQDFRRVFPDAINLQHELNIVGAEFDLGELDLLGSYDARDLSRIKLRAEEIERSIIAAIETHGIKINRYDTLEQFLSANS